MIVGAKIMTFLQFSKKVVEKSDIFNHFFKKQASCEGPLTFYFVRIDKIDC
jgi:hypothetical protein